MIDTVTVDDTTVDSITGTLRTKAGSYDALFYASETCDIDGFGEGQRYIGSETIVADAGGLAKLRLCHRSSREAGWRRTSRSR